MCCGQSTVLDKLKKEIERFTETSVGINIYRCTRDISEKQHCKNIISRVQNRHKTTRIVMESVDSKI